MIISMDEVKAFDKIQNLFVMQNIKQIRNRRERSQLNEGHLQKPIAKLMLIAFSLSSGTRQGCPFWPLLFKIVLEV